MADSQVLAHNDAYFTADTRRRLDAVLLGENVARAPSLEAAHRALMESPSHRANLLDARFGVVGMAAVKRDGTWWVTQDFVQPRAAAPAPAPAPAPAAPAAPVTGRDEPAERSRGAAAGDVPIRVDAEPVPAPAAGSERAGEPLAPVTTTQAAPVFDLAAAPDPTTADHLPAGLAGSGVLALLVAAALLGQRSWRSASSRIRWRWSPRATSSV